MKTISKAIMGLALTSALAVSAVAQFPGGPVAAGWTIKAPANGTQFLTTANVTTYGDAAQDPLMNYIVSVRMNATGIVMQSAGGKSTVGPDPTWGTNTLNAPNGGWVETNNASVSVEPANGNGSSVGIKFIANN